MINNCQITGNNLKSLKSLPSPTLFWQLGHKPLARLSFPKAVPSLEAGNDMKPQARGSETLWQNHDMENKRETGWAAAQRITGGSSWHVYASTRVLRLSSWEPQLDCQINHLLLYSQLQNVSAAALNCSERKEIEKLFLHPYHSRCFYKLKKKEINSAFYFGPLLYHCSVSEMLFTKETSRGSQLFTDSAFRFMNVKVVFLYTFQYCFLV